MKRLLKWIGLGVAGLLVLVGLVAAHTWYFQPLSVEWLYTRAFAQFALDNPEMLTQLRLLEPIGIRGHNARLADGSEEHQVRLFARIKRDYGQLKSYDASRYTGQERLSYEIFADFLGRTVRGEPWRLYDYPVNPLAGIQSELPNLMVQAQQVRDATDAEHYIARLGEFPRRLGQVVDGLKLRESRGLIPPQFVVEKSLDQIAVFVAPGASGNVLTQAFKDKLAKIPAAQMDEATRAALQARVQESVAAHVLPAYAALTAYLNTLKSKATRNDGVWALPDGDRFYQYQIELHTTTTRTADELHQLGLAEVARIGAEIDRLLMQIGYAEGTRAERLRALAHSPEQQYENSDAGRAEVLRDYQRFIDEISSGMDPYFGLKPKAGVRVERVPVFMEKTAPLAYYDGPSLDGSRPGIFFTNLRDVREIPRYQMRSTAYHETVPGHHIQTSIAQELRGLPIFRSLIPFTAYAEGWALYCEQLAGEMGYLADPRDKLGQLQLEMLRSVRLVVDTGMHAKRWTREQAIEYMITNSGIEEKTVVSEIERYLVAPGQALAYKVGMLKILELREKAKAALGARFDIREFHDEILKNGAMPLTLLEKQIENYLERKKL
jgi:uncharacterized protein (DUF885 family)